HELVDRVVRKLGQVVALGVVHDAPGIAAVDHLLDGDVWDRLNHGEYWVAPLEQRCERSWTVGGIADVTDDDPARRLASYRLGNEFLGRRRDQRQTAGHLVWGALQEVAIEADQFGGHRTRVED